MKFDLDYAESEREYAPVNYDELGNSNVNVVLSARSQPPQYDEVEFVRDQYVSLNPNHSTCNSDA